ncbi:phage resistance protein [Protofrankia symbiont of Coriaria ruscifolia]|uniref:phage resistance protein n=1 Tax=Protofrankia symbiont of Coriaria ruscifolia TaxID=1306542 RepID=UPI0010417CC6|nr:phage resistance protein [Protofrankia symbiont of Coriaria ruscifolia]
MTLISELIDVPETVHSGDFVLDLAQGVTHIERTLRDYIVTPELAIRFGEALGIIKGALTDRSSKAAYLDGSFGSGKSHFMAVLSALLANHPGARGIGELAPAVGKFDGDVIGKRFLLVPYHLVGRQTLEEAVLGGYVAHVQKLHPDAPMPDVLIDTPLINTAIALRARLGGDAFFGLLGKDGSDKDKGWGDLARTWDAGQFEAALRAGPDSTDRKDLVTALQQALTGFADLARSAGTGYVNIDDGLAAISQHAASLGYDALVLFLDELILWFATKMADHAWVANEAPKVAKLVESANADRPVPIVSFVARQRDLRELVGTNLPGTDHLAFADSLKWWEGRFGSVKLSDNNLPVIASKRLLKPRSAEARAQIDTAFTAMDQVRQDIRSALMTAHADRQAFRLTYPFSPAFVETLVALSGALQRERTALRVMQQLLVDQRNTLALGQLVPVSDLFDVLVANDEPISGELGALWRNAQKVYAEIRRLILESHGLVEEAVGTVPPTHAVHRDDRIAKTLVLAALMPEVSSMRDLTARKIVALNHGYIRSMVPGQETGAVLQVVRQWAARLGTVQLTGDDASPLISVRLDGIDIEGVLDNAKGADSDGTRRQAARTLVFEALGASKEVTLDRVTTYTTIWRGTRRGVELVYGTIRDPGDLGDSMFVPTHGGWRVAFGFPFDEEGHSPVEDLDRAGRLRGVRPARTICWVPRHFTAHVERDLGRYVRLQYALGPSFDQLAGHLSDNDKAIAKQQMAALRDQLRSRLSNALLQAYGVVTPDETLVDTAHGGIDMFVSLEPGFTPKVPAGAGLRQAFENLLDQLLSWEHPAHPHFPAEVRQADLRKVHAQVRRAIEHPEHRIMVEPGERPLMKKVANPLRLGEQHDQYFVLGHHWEQHLGRRIVEAEAAGKPVTVRDLRLWLDEPRGMGLPQEIADLVLLVFAEQTNRSIVLGQPIDVSALQPLPADARVAEEPLPDGATWLEARDRAHAIFAVADITELCTARNVGLLAERVRRAVADRTSVARALYSALVDKGPAVLRGNVDAGATERVRIAEGVVRLGEELAAATDNVALIDALAAFDLAGVPLHMGRSLSTATDLVAAVRRVDWDIFATVTSWGPGHPQSAEAKVVADELAGVWVANEWAKHLQPVLGKADREARRLLLEATRVRDPTPPLPPMKVAEEGDRVVDRASVTDMASVLSALAAQGRRVRVTWKVVE